MSDIADTDLRDNLDEVLRRVQVGEVLTVTAEDRPVAEIRPAAEQRWASGQELRRIWETPAPEGLSDDLARFGG